MVAINTDTEIGGWISAGTTGASKSRGSADRQVTKADAERGRQNDTNAVNAIKGTRPPSTNHGFLVSKNATEESAGERRIPGSRNAWPNVRVVRVIRIFSMQGLD